EAGGRGQEKNGIVRTSAVTGEGIDALRREILHHVAGEATGQRESGFLTNVRHQGLVREAITGLDAGRRALDQNIPHEMMLLDLYTALHALDAITGATTTDDILNLIFSSFCIGK
ncbi:MAG: tRNA uridine-5-carboxymethylaminomethyl(34) synthesis GTPase MnmE, partial [Terriglobales bacterium]